MKTAITVLALSTLVQFVSQAQPAPATDHLDHRFGAGLILGEPTGVSLKYWFDDTWAIDGAITSSFHRDTALQVHSDILWHAFDLFNVSRGRLPLYLGLGARVKFPDGDDQFGIRAPIGVSYMFDNAPVDIFVEMAPILDLAPSVRGDFNVATGVRFWF